MIGRVEDEAMIWVGIWTVMTSLRGEMNSHDVAERRDSDTTYPSLEG